MLKYYSYTIPFSQPFRTSNATYTSREGIILSFHENEFIAYGEVAPLPDFSGESLEDVLTVLIHNKPYLEQAFKNDDASQILSVLDSIHNFPSLSFGLDVLHYDLQAKRKDISLSKLLFGRKPGNVACNATIGIQPVENAFSEIRKKKELGFSTFKIKMGENFENEYEFLKKIRDEFPDIKLRIDPNGKWETDQAIRYLNDISHLGIEYCEQPVHPRELNALMTVQDHSEIKIAADESVRGLSSVQQLVRDHMCDLLIIKPDMLGRIDNLFVTKEVADSHNIEIVFTTLLNGIIGRVATGILSAGLGSSFYAHGLATGYLLSDPDTPDNLKDGCYVFPDKPGIGVSVDLTPFKEIISV